MIFTFSTVLKQIKRFLDIFPLSIKVLIVMGSAIRLYWLFHNPSLWFDEAILAADIIHRPFDRLLGQMGWQAAPVGFIALAISVSYLFGPDEISLRTLSLLSSVMALPLLYILCRKLSCSRVTSFLTLYLVVFSPPFISYSVQFKQYSFEVLIAVSMLAGAFYWRRISSWRGYCWVFLSGVLGFIFSFSSLMVFSSVLVFLLLTAEGEKNFFRVKAVALVALLWLIFLIAYYKLYITQSLHIGSFQRWWLAAKGMPGHKSIFSDMRLICCNLIQAYSEACIMPFWFGIGVFSIGVVSLVRRNVNVFVMLVLPGFIMLILTLFQLYPLTLRLMLFILPVFFIFIAEGFSTVYYWMKNISLKGALAGLFLFCVIFFNITPKPYMDCHFRQALDFIVKNRHHGDVILTTYYSSRIMPYYHNFYNIPTQALLPELKPLRYPDLPRILAGHRYAWVLIAHTDWDNVYEYDWFLRYCRNIRAIYSFGSEKVLFLALTG